MRRNLRAVGPSSAARGLPAGEPPGAVARPTIDRARAAQETGRTEEATNLCRSVLAEQPRHAEAHYLLGVALAQQRQPGPAGEHLETAVALRPDMVEFQHGLGLLRLKQGEFEAAIECFASAVRTKPDFVPALNNLGAALRRVGRLEEAIASWRRASVLKRGLQAAGSERETFSIVTRFKLKHDIEQMSYLRALDRLPGSYDDTIAAYGAVLDSLPDGPEAPIFFRLGAEHRKLICATYNRLIHRAEAPAHAESPINPALPAHAVEATYAASPPGIVHVDGLLTPRALADLRRFCLESTIWFDFKHDGGYLGAYLYEGFDCGLLLQIAEGLRRTLPGIFGPHRLAHLWAYKYDSRLTGIGLHADAAAVNVNFWLTPDSANLDPDGGGLVVYDRAAPADWDFAKFNLDVPAIRGFLEETGSHPVKVPYRQNRAVIFDSDLFHATDRFAFAEGYENRRINVTMLFGRRGEAA
jgi:tetratricopeptide (TPR) repeat protein